MRTLEESAGETARLGRIVRIIGWAVAVGAIPSVAHNALAARSTSALVLLVAQGGALAAVACVSRGHLDAGFALLVTVIGRGWSWIDPEYTVRSGPSAWD